MSEIHKRRVLKDALIEAFSLEDLNTLCFDLRVDYERIPGADKETKAREIVIYFDQHGRLEELWRAVDTARPHRKLNESLDAAFPSTAAPAPTKPTIPRQIPPPVSDFIGREQELAKLKAAVEQGGLLISGLQGQGGVGKTELARKLAAELEAHYPGGQLLVELNGVPGDAALPPEQGLQSILYSFIERSQPLPQETSELRKLYYSLLNDRQVLILLDNARDRAQVEAFCPPPRGCLVLVTSRARFVLPGMRPFDLDALPPHEAEALLLQIAPRIDADAPTLAALCGCLPLALRVLASTLNERSNLSIPDTIRRMQDATQRLKITGADASLAMSYNQLPARLQEKWRQLAVFNGDFKAKAAAWVWGIITDKTPQEQDEKAVDAAQDLLSELLCYNLVDYETSTGCYSLHDLARAYAAQRMRAEEEYQARLNHAGYYFRVLNKANELYRQGGDAILKGLALFDRERREIEVGQAWAAGATESQRERLVLCSEYAWQGSILNLRLHARIFISWLDAALKAARLLQNQQAQGAHLNNLGLAYSALGETRKASEYHEQALVINRKIGYRLGEGNALGNLGAAYANLGETQKAITNYKQALVIDREIGNRHGEGVDLGNLGIAYKNLGETQKAIAYYKQQLAIAREIGDRQGEGRALGNLGNAYADLDDTQKAIEYYEQNLTIAREIGDRQGEGSTLGNLGIAYKNLGETQKAIEYYEQNLTIAREIGDRLGEAIANWNLGLVYEKQGDLARAEALMQVLVDYERAIGHANAEKDAARVEEIRKKIGRLED